MELPSRHTLLAFENSLWSKGFSSVAGMDEAGRGPLAGPVVAAIVIFEKDYYIDGVYDSKALSASKRSALYDIITQNAVCYSLGIVDNNTIDRINILEATKLAMLNALSQLKTKPDFVLIDAVDLRLSIPYSPIIKGDQKSFSIAAASIIAKVYRDRLMDQLHIEYPFYNWDKNKGYGTLKHRDAIKETGFSPYHRKSFTVK